MVLITEEKLGLLAPENYDYLNQSGTYTVEGTDDVKEFKETMRGISKIEEVFWNSSFLKQNWCCCCFEMVSHVGDWC